MNGKCYNVRRRSYVLNRQVQSKGVKVPEVVQELDKLLDKWEVKKDTKVQSDLFGEVHVKCLCVKKHRPIRDGQVLVYVSTDNTEGNTPLHGHIWDSGTGCNFSCQRAIAFAESLKTNTGIEAITQPIFVDDKVPNGYSLIRAKGERKGLHA